VSIALSIGNNLTTGGVFTADAVNNTSVTNVTDFASVPGGGALKLLSTQTASASASLEFSLDDSYDSYIFKFINIHPQNNAVDFQFNGSTDNGSNYNVVKTTTQFNAYHNESGTDAVLGYNAGYDLAQSTSFKNITNDISNENDMNTCAVMQIFNPSSTTFAKHFIGTANNNYFSGGYFQNDYFAGYFNTTSAITNLKFQMSSGNIDSGIIKMYGVV